MQDRWDESMRIMMEGLDSMPKSVDLDKEAMWMKIEKRLQEERINKKWYWNRKWLLGLTFFMSSVSIIAWIYFSADNKLTFIKEKESLNAYSLSLKNGDTFDLNTVGELPNQDVVKKSGCLLKYKIIDSILPINDSIINPSNLNFEEVYHSNVVHMPDEPVHVNQEHENKKGVEEELFDGKFYFKQHHNIVGFNQNLDRERTFMDHTRRSLAEYFSNTNPDTIRNGKVSYYYLSGQLYETDIIEDYQLVSRKRYFKNGQKMSVEKRNIKSSKLPAGNMPRGIISSAANGVNKNNSSSMLEYTINDNWYSEMISSDDRTGNKLVKAGTGIYKEYYSNDSLKTIGEYKEGIPVGEWKGYYQDGRLMYDAYYNSAYVLIVNSIYDASGNELVKNGWGKCVLKYANGKVQFIGNYKEGKLNGEVESFYSNGQLKSKSYYEGFKLSGLYTSYFINGQVICTGNFRLHQKIGEWTWYDAKGKTIGSVVYK